MQKKLIVTTRFGGYSVGDEITDPQEVNDLLSNEHSAHVVQAHHEPEYEDEMEPEDVVEPGKPAKRGRKPKGA